MSATHEGQGCEHLESVLLWVLQSLPPAEAGKLEAHVAACSICSAEIVALQPVVDALASWPVDVLRPPRPLWERLADRIAADTGRPPLRSPPRTRREPQWEEVAPGIQCKLLASAPERVSMLVRLAPNTEYPPHEHAGVEELHLLDGELWIDDRKLYPGDYSRKEPGTVDHRVWSETGCTCVLVTSPSDVLR